MLLVNASSGISAIHRLGLIAHERLSIGTKITEHREGFDLSLSTEQLEALPPTVRMEVLCHSFFYKGRYLLDSDSGRFTNHAANPNTLQIGRSSFAIARIEPGEEITLNYNDLGFPDQASISPDDLRRRTPITFDESDASATLLDHTWVINGETGIHLGRTNVGWGAFASRDFAKGEHVLTFTGPLLTLQQTQELGHWGFYAVQTGENQYVDCLPPGAFCNHSCNPNCGIKNSVRLVALKPIARGEEILMDYSACMSGDPETMECCCGSERCRGVIGNFEDLPEQIRDEYLSRGMVSDFIITR